MKAKCPTEEREPGDIVGCGMEFEATPDNEGLVDCPNCGLWFVAEPPTPVSLKVTRFDTESSWVTSADDEIRYAALLWDDGWLLRRYDQEKGDYTSDDPIRLKVSQDRMEAFQAERVHIATEYGSDSPVGLTLVGELNGRIEKYAADIREAAEWMAKVHVKRWLQA